MFTAIIALIGSVVGVVGGVITQGRQMYIQKQGEYQANKDYARSKELAWYGAYSSQQQTTMLIIAASIIGIIIMAYTLNKSK